MRQERKMGSMWGVGGAMLDWMAKEGLTKQMTWRKDLKVLREQTMWKSGARIQPDGLECQGLRVHP